MSFAKKNSKPNALFSCTPTRTNKNNSDSVNTIISSKIKLTPDHGKSAGKPSPARQLKENKPIGVPDLLSEKSRSRTLLRRSQSANSLFSYSPTTKQHQKLRSESEVRSPSRMKTVNRSPSITDILNKRIPQSPSKLRTQSPSKTLSEPRLRRCQIDVSTTTNGQPKKTVTVSSSFRFKDSGLKGSAIDRHESIPIQSDTTPVSRSVQQIKTRFEKKTPVVRTTSKPPPSPSPIKRSVRFADPQRLVNTVKESPRVVIGEQNSGRLKSILNPNSRSNEASPFVVPVSASTPVNRCTKLRRSVSAQDLDELSNVTKYETPRQYLLPRSNSDAQTSKHRRFYDSTPECYSPVLMDTPSSLKKQVCDVPVGESTNLTVGVRVRPPNPGENVVISVDGNTINVDIESGIVHCFAYDHCFISTGPQAADQQHIFTTMVQPLVETAFQGYNVCLFAYGQTGSGKSYSMMGLNYEFDPDITKTSGIIPRFCYELFKEIETNKCAKMEISYFEIYNEKIHDLLAPTQGGRGEPLRVREHPVLGPYVVNLTAHKVHSFETVQNWLRVGDNLRASAATDMNENSSRSHSIFSITMTQTQTEEGLLEVPSLCSKINLVDLAGSERITHTSASADRLRESVSINKSLLTLGKVICSLAENKKRGFIPYRESVLTWLLRESLGGNSKTVMLATVSPGVAFIEETLSTLRYACQARSIVNTMRINESAHEKRIRELSGEVQRLQLLCKVLEENGQYQLTAKVNSLQLELSQVKKQLTDANKQLDRKQKDNLELEETNRLLRKRLELQKNEFDKRLRQFHADEEYRAKKFAEMHAKVEKLEDSLFVLHEREEKSKPLLEQLEKLNILCAVENKENEDANAIVAKVKTISEKKNLLDPTPEDIHEALKEAADVCCRLRLPYIFHLEPEVTTHTWFNINVRVTDKDELSSVRWTQSAFLSWLQTMKDNITSSSRGRILFKDAEWIQKVELEAVPFTPIKDFGISKKDRPLREEVTNLKKQIASLENLCQQKDKREVTTALNTLVDAVNNLTLSLGVCTPSKGALQPITLQKSDMTPKSAFQDEKTLRRNLRLLNT